MNDDPDTNLVRAHLRRHENLGPLAERAADLIELRRLYRASVPVGLAQASELANFRDGVLIIEATNSATVAKLKQLTPRLIAVFLEKGRQVSAIKVQVQGGS